LGKKTPLLLEHAANCAFWDLPVGILQKILADEPDQEVNKDWKRPELVLKLMKAVLKCSDAVAAGLLEGSIAAYTSADEDVLGSEEVAQCVDDTDRDKVVAFLKSKAAEKSAAAEISGVVRDLRKKAGVKERKPVGLPKNITWSQEEVKKLLPTNATILRDQFSGRWRVFGMARAVVPGGVIQCPGARIWMMQSVPRLALWRCGRSTRP